VLVAALSDSHDHRQGLAEAVSRADAEGADALFHMGDLVSPFMLPVLAGFPRPVYLVIGNNDGDRLAVFRALPRECPQVAEYGEIVTAVLDGCRIAAVHDPRVARGLAATGDHDLVLFGHTHQHSVGRVGACLMVNPGELYGLRGPRSMCFIDTLTREVERVVL